MIATRRFLPGSAPPMPPGSDPATAWAGEWPKGVLRERWEGPWRTFTDHYAERFGARLPRPVVYLWITGNKIRSIHEMLGRRYPGYAVPGCESLDLDDDDDEHPAPDVSQDPDFRHIALFDDPCRDAMLACSYEDITRLRILKAQWSNVVGPEQLAAIKFDRSEDPDW